VNAAGDLDASQSDLTIRNNDGGASSGARASFASTGGAIDLGGVDVRTVGNGAGLLMADGVDDVTATDVLYVGATSGSGTIQLASSAGTTSVGSAGSASVITGNSLAKIDIAGATSVSIDGAVSATATNGAALVNADGDTVSVGSGADVRSIGSAGATLGLEGTSGLQIDGALLAQSAT